MSIHVKTAAGWEELGVSGSGGGSAWGDFTTNGDETTSDTWGPDAQGRTWKWAEWNDADSGPYEIDLGKNGGLYWVLTVGGGSRSYSDVEGLDRGQPGLVNEGLWEFGPGTHAVTVGERGRSGADNDGTKYGQPSSVGDYGTQAISSYGDANTGRGATFGEDAGYKSSITGTESEYATSKNGADVPGRSGAHRIDTANPGCVIIATAAPNAKALNWVHTTYHAEVNDDTVTAVYTQKHYADGTTTPLPTAELVDATYGVSEGWLFVDGELQPPPPPPLPTLKERIEALQEQLKDLQKDT